VYQQALEIGAGEALQQVLLSTPAYQFGLGDLFYEWGELEAAEQHLARAAAQIHAPMVTDAEMTMQGYIALARLKQAQADPSGALAALDACEQIGRERRFVPPLFAYLAAARARMALMQGDLPAALRWAEASVRRPDDEPSFPHEAEYLTLARVLIEQGHYAQALGLLGRMLQAAEAGARSGSVLRILLLQSLAHQDQGDLPGALRPLARALTLAAPEGYVRLFADEGSAMGELLRQAHARGIVPDYVATLLAAFPAHDETSRQGDMETSSSAGNAISRSPGLPVSSSLAEALNERELEVLRLIALGHSNREIADLLVIALSTVKTHINNCYGKLGVHSRTQALARARELGLI
jgi:LuxR family maltose regulon positive regulatory protein